jgi:hypothetical protein
MYIRLVLFTPPLAATLRARLSAHGLNLPDGYADIARAFLGYRVERAPLVAEWDEAGDEYLATFGDTPDAPENTAPTPRAPSPPDEHTAKLFTATRNFKLGEVRRLTTLRRLPRDAAEAFARFGFTPERESDGERHGLRRINARLMCEISVPTRFSETIAPRGALLAPSETWRATFHPNAVLPGMKYYQPSAWELEALSAEDRDAFFTLGVLAWVAFFGVLVDSVDAQRR